MMAVGSNFRVSMVDRAVTPKPCGDVIRRHDEKDKSQDTHQRRVGHTKNDYTLMLRCILRYTAQMSFDDMVSVQKRHLAVWFYPHL
jgi:hypothetical protein